MSDDLTAVIGDAIADAGNSDGGGAVDTTPTVDTSVVTADPAAAPVVPELDDIGKLIAAEGYKPAPQGQRENRIPYSRVQKITEKARKEIQDKWDADKKAAEDRITAAQERVKFFENLDHVATTDPERYLAALAKANPAYQAYLDARKAGTNVAQPVVDARPAGAADPMPLPTETYPDGSKGYSQEGLGELLKWQGRQTEQAVEKRIMEAVTKQYGPLAEAHKSQVLLSQNAQKVRSRLDSVAKQWGADFFNKHENDILAALKADQSLTLELAAMQVLVPKLRADRTSMREDVLKELQQRPAAASATPGATPSGGVATGPQTTEEAIREAIRSAGRR